MKLKKIASLALAGVMAVSMLAACGTDANTNTNTNTDTSTGIDLAATMGEYNTGDADVDFTNDAKLTSVLKQVLAAYGTKAYDNGVTTDFVEAVKTAGSLKDVIASEETWHGGVDYKVNWQIDSDGTAPDNDKYYFVAALYNGTTAVGTYNNLYLKTRGDLDGKTYTCYEVVAIKANTEELAVNRFASEMANKISTTLPAESLNADKTQIDSKYYAYTYDCSVGMTSMKDEDGKTVYYFIYGLNQHVTEKTVG